MFRQQVERGALVGFWNGTAGTLFRWVAFLPAAFVAQVLVHMLAFIAEGGRVWLLGGSFDAPIVRVLAGAASGVASVWVGSRVAPTIKKGAPAIITAAVLCLLALAAIGIDAAVRNWAGVFDVAATGIAAGVAAAAIQSGAHSPRGRL